MFGWKDLLSSYYPPAPSVPPPAPVPSAPVINQFYYCGDETSEPISRDLYLDFCSARREQGVFRNYEYRELENNLESLKMKIQMQAEAEAKNTANKPLQADLASRLWQYIPFQAATTSNPSSMDLCEYCQTLTNHLNVCSLCASTYCSHCSQEKIPIETPKVGKHDVPVCIPCKNLFGRYEERKERAQKMEESEGHPLCRCTAMLNDLEQCIIRTLPKYEAVALSIKEDSFPEIVEVLPDIFEEAMKYENILSSFYDNYQMALNKIKRYQPVTEKENTLLNRFIQGKMSVYQKWYPPFRILKAEVKERIPKLKKSDILKAPTKPVSKVSLLPNKSEPPKPVKPPVIIAVEPSVIPKEGADLVIRGYYFHSGAKVVINGHEVPTVFINSDTLYTQVQACPVSGDIPLFVRNPDADSERISLFYAEQSEIDDINTSIENNASPIRSSDMDNDNFDLRHNYPKLELDHSVIRLPKTDPKTAKKRKLKSKVAADEDIEEIIQITQLDRDIYCHSEPEISTVTPLLSPPSGILVTITGYKFAKNVKVSFGPVTMNAATSYSLNGSKVECVVHCHSPALAEGTYSVSVRNPKGSVALLEDIFCYLPFKMWLTVTNPDTPPPTKNSNSFSKNLSRLVWGE